MSADEELRALARAPKDDEVARERLEREWIRRGLGWNGEALPPGVLAKPERGVYGAFVAPIWTELVYVPGGEVECSCGHSRGDHAGAFGGASFGPECSRCSCTRSDGYHAAPFYLGRFPVTVREFLLFQVGRPRSTSAAFVRTTSHLKLEQLSHDELACPVTSVNREGDDGIDAFMRFAGLRLPTADEWAWAALGAPRPSLDAESPGQWRSGAMTARRFPWGDAPPDRSRAVFAREISWSTMDGGGVAGEIPDPSRKEPVTDCAACVRGDCYHAHACARRPDVPSAWKEPLVPARPAGASWCGALDLWHVGEVVDGPSPVGGSFRTADWYPRTSWTYHAVSDGIGFRVALDAAKETP